ncbi:MAG: hypothetical protein GY775_19900, partial [Candidatus Scalindua sp.]|nr:hypothetical protein [Candidatus Scalindua sp.]
SPFRCGKGRDRAGGAGREGQGRAGQGRAGVNSESGFGCGEVGQGGAVQGYTHFYLNTHWNKAAKPTRATPGSFASNN